jgi:hypothetical protein
LPLVDTGGNLTPVSLTPAANLLPVSLTPMAKFATGVVDTRGTSGKFTTGVVDTGGAP